MARAGHFALITLILLTGCYLAFSDARQILAGEPFPSSGVYGAVGFLVSASLLFVDFFRKSGGQNDVA